MSETASTPSTPPSSSTPSTPSSPDDTAPQPTFDAIPLTADVRKAIDEMGYKNPTPVQLACYDPVVRGKDVKVQARTGTGKTTAFGLPIVDQIVRRSGGLQVLCLCPTRELALQVAAEVQKLGKHKGVRVSAVYGGAPMGRQIAELEEGAQVVIGTPGRVLDHLRRGTMDAKGIRTLVLDEADEMLSMGFEKELNAIVERLPKGRQTLLFSATLSNEVGRLVREMNDPETILLSGDQVGALELTHFFYLQRGDKTRDLLRVLEIEDPQSAILFCNTKDDTETVARELKRAGYQADYISGDLDQKEREKVMAATREGRLRFLVATDVAARGIDISHLTHVINVDFPDTPEQYVHRTGRTGRAGRTGTAISLIAAKDIGNLYYLRLTYGLRPIERTLPTEQELATRREADLVARVEAAAKDRPSDADARLLARRVLAHDDAEGLVGVLLRQFLGSHLIAAEEAAKARRARNPEPVQEAPARSEVSPRTPRAGEAPTSSKEAVTRRDRPHERAEGERGPTSGRGDRTERQDRGRDRDPNRDRDRGRGPRQPHAQLAEWSPPQEADDEAPILAKGAKEGTREERREERQEPPKPAFEVATVFVSAGRRDGIRAIDLLRLLSEKASISQEDVGRIRIRDRNTFLDVRVGLSDKAIAALKGAVIGGRTVNAEPARPRDDAPEGEPSPPGERR